MRRFLPVHHPTISLVLLLEWKRDLGNISRADAHELVETIAIGRSVITKVLGRKLCSIGLPLTVKSASRGLGAAGPI